MSAVPVPNGRRGYVIQHTASIPTDHRRETENCAEAECGAHSVNTPDFPQDQTSAGHVPAKPALINGETT